MSPRPDPAFLKAPITHRALHDVTDGRPENSREAVLAAVEAGYGIEIDLQLSKDGEAMVFHDYDLARLTGVSGPIRQRTAAELSEIPLLGGTTGAPLLSEVLELVAGRVPLLIEIKDQDGALGPNVGPLEKAAAEALDGYDGPVAVMSFNPHSVAAFGEYAPDIPRGLTTESFPQDDWMLVPATRLEELRPIPDFERTGASFISHEAADLDRPDVARIKATGAPVFCWTIRSTDEEAKARQVADNVTFEGYLAAIPA